MPVHVRTRPWSRVPDRRVSRLTGVLLGCVAAFAFCMLPACNTVEGAGEDVEAAGDSLEQAAE